MSSLARGVARISFVLAAFVLAASGAPRVRALDVELRPGETALAVESPLRLELETALPANLGPFTLGAVVLPEAQGAALTLGARAMLVQFGDHRLWLALAIGPIALGLDGASLGPVGTTSLQLVLCLARLQTASLLLDLAPRLDGAVVWGELEQAQVRTGGTVALGLSWPTGAVWLRGELAAGFDEHGPPVMRASGGVVVAVRP